MTRLVGHRDRTEFVLDPAEALRQGRRVDAQLSSCRPPRSSGVSRATHRRMNELDDLRQLEAARRLNGKS
jgi:hypothetical protein